MSCTTSALLSRTTSVLLLDCQVFFNYVFSRVHRQALEENYGVHISVHKTDCRILDLFSFVIGLFVPQFIKRIGVFLTCVLS